MVKVNEKEAKGHLAGCPRSRGVTVGKQSSFFKRASTVLYSSLEFHRLCLLVVLFVPGQDNGQVQVIDDEWL